MVSQLTYIIVEVNNGNESDCKKNIEKVIQKWWIYYNAKLMLKHFGFIKPSSGLRLWNKCC